MVFRLGVKYTEIDVLPTLHTRTQDTRYRVPDVTVLLTPPPEDETDYLRVAAFVIIEILSAKDAMASVFEKLDEYSQMGVPHIWLIDPLLQRMFVCKDQSLVAVPDVLATENPRIELARAEAFPKPHRTP